jgi:hypothetical protein
MFQLQNNTKVTVISTKNGWSKIKYKKCCLDSKKEYYSHIHVLFENRDPEDFKNQQTKTFGTWKT